MSRIGIPYHPQQQYNESGSRTTNLDLEVLEPCLVARQNPTDDNILDDDVRRALLIGVLLSKAIIAKIQTGATL